MAVAMDNAILENILRQVRPLIGQGKVADYIPALATVDGSRLGIAICTVDGQLFQAGDAQERFFHSVYFQSAESRCRHASLLRRGNLATRRQRSVWITIQFFSATGNGAGYSA
ncbi:glutaminase 2 [Escherichia coli]|uniref:glutaminase n=1 Tax=Escherichia coli TaxID=562 RepID=A0A377K6B5_ECOLX|nr:glutaminase 2 [Escherichia coli]